MNESEKELDLVDEAYKKLDHVEIRLFAKSIGKTYEEVPKAIIPFFKVIPSNISGYDYDNFFAALCIKCLFEEQIGDVVSTEEFIRDARESKNLGSIDSFDRRISALMSNTEAKFFILKLGKLISYAKNFTNLIPNCNKFYEDLKNLNNTRKTV